ncbi:MAG TPA: Sec-independent protein translocase protein TatB [Acidimicrobiales bacterium]
MFNVSAVELMVILTLGLIVLGPQKLPEAARQVGRVVTELRRMANGFQTEMRDALRATETSVPASRPPLADAPGARADAAAEVPEVLADPGTDQPAGQSRVESVESDENGDT